MEKTNYTTLIIGASAGGLQALSKMLPLFSADFPLTIIIINHRMNTPDTYLTELLGKLSALPVEEAENFASIEPGHIYIAPAGYHLLIGDDQCFNLSADPPVNGSKPSIDVTFETAAEVYGAQLIGLILTGANSDGTAGLKKIQQYGGYVMAQSPKDAEVPTMPESAIAACKVDFIGSLQEIVQQINKITTGKVTANG